MSQFQIGNFENRGGGIYFSKMSQFQLFDSVFCNITFIRQFSEEKAVGTKRINLDIVFEN